MSYPRRWLCVGLLALIVAPGCSKAPSDGSDEFGRPDEQRPKAIEEMRQKQMKDASKKAP
jgi:hypothetical protein